MAKITARPVALADRAAWDILWKNYTQFYGAAPPREATEILWARLHDATSTVKGIVAVDGKRVIGIAHYVLMPNTWGRHYICYLEDLFVARSARRRGAAQAMIRWLRTEALKQDWTRVFWMTEAKNKTAQALYNRIATRTGWVRYDLDLKKPLKPALRISRRR